MSNWLGDEYYEKRKILEKIMDYVQCEIEDYDDFIVDCIENDSITNSDIIAEAQEKREHWVDLIRIYNNNPTRKRDL